jgi:secondary thiamine-phosphate synthase enzyme
VSEIVFIDLFFCGIIGLMTFSKKFKLSTKGFCDLHDLTIEVQTSANKSGIKEGLACVSVAHSTCGITTIEYEPNLVKDFCNLMERLVPQDLDTQHGSTWGDDNGFSHLRAALIGPSVTTPIVKGQLALGTWQQIILCDFDNRARTREVVIQITGK